MNNCNNIVPLLLLERVEEEVAEVGNTETTSGSDLLQSSKQSQNQASGCAWSKN